MTAAPHPRFRVQGHILSTGGNALIDLISLNQLSVGRNVICTPLGGGLGLTSVFKDGHQFCLHHKIGRKKTTDYHYKKWSPSTVVCLHYRYPGQLYYIKSFLGCNLMEFM
jgi:hypothetical protein